MQTTTAASHGSALSERVCRPVHEEHGVQGGERETGETKEGTEKMRWKEEMRSQWEQGERAMVYEFNNTRH